MRRFIFSLLAVLVLMGTAFAGEWTLVKYQGRDHVTLENVAQFYSLNSVERVSNDVTLRNGARSLRCSVGSNEFYINNLKFILSYPVEEVDGRLIISRMDLTKVIEPVLRPSRIKGAELVNTIVLDPGHGGHDNGAMSSFGCEKDYTLDVALRARDVLQQMGYKVYMTRTTDEFIPLEDRVRFANRFSNALFISIHFNSGGSAASGLETYTLAPRGVPSMAADGPRLSDLQPCPGNVRDAENIALATATHASLVYHSQMFDRGIKRARFVVIRDIQIPGVLVEGGFLSNPEDSRRIASTAYRQQMAQCIGTAVRNYRAAVSTAPQNIIASQTKLLSPVAENKISSASDPTQPKSDEPVVVTSPAAN
jgi:N-acetylmuramoyl-L-alanine amidase